MKRRLLTAVITGAIGAAVGVAVAIWQGLDYKFGIGLGTGVVGFFFGLVFNITGV